MSFFPPPSKSISSKSQPRSLLYLSFRSRTVAVFRDQCPGYKVGCPCYPPRVLVHPLAKCYCLPTDLIASVSQDIITIARSTFLSLRELPIEAIVIMALPPDHRIMRGYAEFGSGTWETVSDSVSHVEIGLKSGASPVVSDDASAVTDRCTSSERGTREPSPSGLVVARGSEWCGRRSRARQIRDKQMKVRTFARAT